MNIIAIIPAYNEERTIFEVIKKTKQGVKKVIVIDDGSTDKTAQVSKDAGAEVLTLKNNSGVGKAFFAGIQQALKHKPDIIINLDADGQFNPDDIPALVSPILKGEADMVTATRTPFKGIPFLKKMGNIMFSRVTSLLIKKRFTDTQCGFRAYSYEAALNLNLFGEFTYTQEAFLDLATKGFKIKEIPLEIKPQREGKSKVVKNVIDYGLRSLTIMMRTVRDNQPLSFFGIPGLILFTLGIGIAGYLGISHLLGNDIADHTSLLIFSLIVLIIGFLTIVLALVADMNERQNKNLERILLKLKEK